MAPTTCQKHLQRFPEVEDIDPDEWYDFFPKQGKLDPEDIEYMRQWIGKDSILNIAYAIGTEPWRVIRIAGELGILREAQQKKAAHCIGCGGERDRPGRYECKACYAKKRKARRQELKATP